MSVPRWIDAHSVNCFLCGNLYDEREGFKFYPEGEICPVCAKRADLTFDEDEGHYYLTKLI